MTYQNDKLVGFRIICYRECPNCFLKVLVCRFFSAPRNKFFIYEMCISPIHRLTVICDLTWSQQIIIKHSEQQQTSRLSFSVPLDSVLPNTYYRKQGKRKCSILKSSAVSQLIYLCQQAMIWMHSGKRTQSPLYQNMKSTNRWFEVSNNAIFWYWQLQKPTFQFHSLQFQPAGPHPWNPATRGQ